MYHLPSNWTAQRSAERESEMGYLARIRKREARDAMDSTITTIENSDPLEAPRQAGGEKAPCVHSEPVTGIRLPVSVREDNHDIPPCILEPPFLLSKEILMLRFILLFHGLPWHETPLEGNHAPKLGVGPSKMLATRQAFLHHLGHTFCQGSNPFKCPGSPGEGRGDRPMDRDPSVNLATNDGKTSL